MASSSGQGCEPPPGDNDQAGIEGINHPLRPVTLVTPQATLALADLERNEQEHDEEVLDEEECDNTHGLLASISWHQIRFFLLDKLFPALATATCILNITAALGYVLLMNDPTTPNPSFIASTLLTWFLTTGMMVVYGILNTGSMKDYVRHLVILAIFTCFVVVVVFHFAGASNFASSFLVGITMAVLLIQIW